MEHYLHVKWYCWHIAQGYVWYYLRLKTNAVQWVWCQCLKSNLLWLKYLLSNPNCISSQIIWEIYINNNSPMVTKNSQAVHQKSVMLKCSNNLSILQLCVVKMQHTTGYEQKWNCVLSLSYQKCPRLYIDKVNISSTCFYILQYNKSNTVVLLFWAGLCDTWIRWHQCTHKQGITTEHPPWNVSG